MNSQELRSLQEAYMDVYEGKVPWNDPENPLQSGHTPAEKNRAKRERTGVEDIEKSPSDKNYATYGAMKSVDDEQSSSSNKNKSTHKFPDVPIRTSKGKPQTIGQLRRSKGVPKPGGSDEKSNLYQSPIKKDDKRTRGGKTDQWKGPNPKTESYDLYDIILSHLLDEGYAETSEAAEAIMVNMSEEWRDSIVDEVLDEELTGERLARADAKMKSLGRKKSTRDARVALDRVARGQEGTGTDGGRKAPTKRGGGGTKGHTKTTGTAGYDSDRGDGNRAARRAGTYRTPMWEQ